MYSLPTTGRKTARALESTLKVSLLVAGRPFRGNSKRGHNPLQSILSLLVLTSFYVGCATYAGAQVTSISLQSPGLSASGTTNVTSPVHVAATAEDLNPITGYVVYADGVNVYRNFSSTVDAWIVLPTGSHKLLVKAWDAHSDLATATYQINVTGFAAAHSSRRGAANQRNRRRHRGPLTTTPTWAESATPAAWARSSTARTPTPRTLPVPDSTSS